MSEERQTDEQQLVPHADTTAPEAAEQVAEPEAEIQPEQVDPPAQAEAEAKEEKPPVEAAPKAAAGKAAAEDKPPKKGAEARRAKAIEESQSPFEINLGKVYEGPLDLLLDLIRKQDIDIYDIPIARITAQFLGYVEKLKHTDVDAAGEFIYTASLLIHIKSKMLLPRLPPEAGDAGESEDPRRELVERLLEHERFKNAAQMLYQKQMVEEASWTNPGMREFRTDQAAESELAVDTVDLVRVFRDVLERLRERPVLNVEEDAVTVGQMVRFLARRLTMEDRPVALSRLLNNSRSERQLVAMFLALLELVRLQAILLRQEVSFRDIYVKKHDQFDQAMTTALAQMSDDWQ